jgi:peroxiredoxin
MKKQIILIVVLGLVTIQTYAQIPDKAEDISPLLIGEIIPDAILKNPDAIEYSVSKILSEKPTVLLFYRGGWCPYCNAHLAEIQVAESEIINLGFQIIAISPDSPENLKLTDEKHKLNYSLYSDSDGEFIKSLGIAFKSPTKYGSMLSEKSNGLNNGFLPAPSVFVVDTAGKIMFEYINPDYKTRLTSSLLIAVLKNLKDSK